MGSRCVGLALEESHACGKEDRHDPEFCRAWVQAVPWICEEDEGEVDVEGGDCGKDNFDVANLDAEGGAAFVEEHQFKSQDNGVDYGDDYIGDAERVGVAVGAI